MIVTVKKRWTLWFDKDGKRIRTDVATWREAIEQLVLNSVDLTDIDIELGKPFSGKTCGVAALLPTFTVDVDGVKHPVKRDFLGNVLHIGDKILVAAANGRNPGADFRHGEIVGFTPKMIAYKCEEVSDIVRTYTCKIVRIEEAEKKT